MGTTAEKLQAILDSKEDIRQAIIAKGISCGTSILLSDYGDKIRSIEQSESVENIETLTITVSGYPITSTPKITLTSTDAQIYQVYIGTSIEFIIQYGVTYTVSFENLQGYHSIEDKTFTASQSTRSLTVEYTSPSASIVFDNSISDPENISGDIYAGQIASICDTTGRCLCKPTADGVAICMLDTEDSTKYLDGTTAILDGTEGDIMVYIPSVSMKSTADTDNDTTEVVISTEAISDGTTFSSRLIGAYKTCLVDNKLFSHSGVSPYKLFSQSEFKNLAPNKGTGWSNITWEDHCLIAMLFYAKYGSRDSQDVIGIGGLNYDEGLTGTTNSLGNQDTSETASGLANNFLGIEAVSGWIYEWIDNVAVNSGVWTITDSDGTTRTATGVTESGWITKMLFESGNNIDLIPTVLGGSDSTYYADYFYGSSSSNLVLARSHYSQNTSGGVSYINAFDTYSHAHNSFGSRLAYHGNITIISDVDTFKALPLTV